MSNPGQYEWEVIVDPEQIFNGVFRWTDIRQSAKDHFWPDGIVFRNRRTGEVAAFRAGQLIVPAPLPVQYLGSAA